MAIGGGVLIHGSRRMLRQRYTLFWRKRFLNDGNPYPEIVGKSAIFCFHDIRCVPGT